MSRLPPYQKTAPFVFPRAPLSPPETTADVAVSTSAFLSAGHEQRSSEIEHSPSYSAPTPERPEILGSRFRRASSITYHASGLRESRERTAQRESKAFVIIIPPPSFDQQHGQLGHTLSSGPRHRLSQGLLMPLFPTMYGQLAAIAREYNFPSTAGLCLYPQFTENGVTMTPRISDESWPLFWSHVLESSSPRSPVSGKIEFDIDQGQARWYASWLGSSHRDYTGQIFSANLSTPPSISYWRGESRSSLPDDDQESHVIAPVARHIPRKLSLVDRYDLTSTRPGSRSASRSAMSPERVQMITQVLSPIFQEEEPKSAIDDRVKEWRANTISKPTPLAAAGQISLEPANMPNVLPIDDSLLIPSNGELKLEDYVWSPSSAGPSDHDLSSLMSPVRLPSVHIASRVQGSVCLTPSDCTSFGPSDYTLPSPQSSTYRLPSPDIAHRMYEDMPPTPSTATSWGPPLEYPTSPSSVFRAPSIDLGERSVFSRCVTPSTATSWVMHRGEYDWPITSSTSASWESPTTPDLGSYKFEHSCVLPMPWKLSWPYVTDYSITNTYLDHSSPAQECRPWYHLWPYTGGVAHPSDVFSTFHRQLQMPLVESDCSLSVLAPSIYPYLVLYQPAYPHFNIYPAPLLAHNTVEETLPSDPYLTLLLDASSQFFRPPQPVNVKIEPGYPIFDLYPATYPRNLAEIYPSAVMVDKSTVHYPCFDLYPAANPQYTNSGTSVLSQASAILPSSRTSVYPDFIIYPPVELGETTWDTLSPAKIGLQAVYPSLVIYPGGYPHIDLYPPVYPPSDAVVASSQLQSSCTSSSNTASSTGCSFYPVFNIYPAVGVPTALGSDASILGYPQFELYVIIEDTCAHEACVIHAPCLYPIFDIYPAIYPFIGIYPSLPHDICTPVTLEDKNCSITAGCLHLDPYVDISNLQDKFKDTPAMSLKIQAQYPAFDLYPAVYPHFNLWPLSDCPRMAPPPTPDDCGQLAHSRLTHSELHAMVMMERIGSSKSFQSQNFPTCLKTTSHAAAVAMELTEDFDVCRSKFYEPVKSLSEELLARWRTSNLKHDIQSEHRDLPLWVPPVGQQMTLSQPSSSMDFAGQILKDCKWDHSTSLSAVPKPVLPRPGSIVSQRVRAFDATRKGAQMPMETLSEFPVPPNPPAE